MLATANPVDAHNSATTPTPGQTRPVRLLVPTVRRSDYWLTAEDTLRASDLGVTRDTTDEQLREIVNTGTTDRPLTYLITGDTTAEQFREIVNTAANDSTETAPITAAEWLLATYGTTDQALTYLIGIRDGLRIPRDVAEARAWGFTVPRDENKQEFSADPRKHLHWWWVYDPTRTETLAQREARYYNDNRIIDMKGFARVLCRAYITIKDLKFEADEVRRILDPNRTEHLDELAAAVVQYGNGITLEQARESLLDKAREDVLDAMPERRDVAGQSDLWHVADAIRYGRRTGRLDQWYEYASIKQTGRPKGSKTRRRKTAAQ